MSKPQPRPQRLGDLVAELALVSGVGYVAAAYAASRWLTKATPGSPRLTPDSYQLPYEKLTCTTVDGHRLAGWLIDPSRARATVILFHGVHNNRSQMLARMAFLAKAGLRCVAFDHRAHGESTGKRTSFGFHERLDVLAILDFVRARWPHQPVAALGISMGAAALCYAAEQTRLLNAVILEGMYHDIGRAFATRLGTYPPWFQRLAHGILWVTERRLGLRISQLAPFQYVGRLSPAPVLVLSGSEDPHAPAIDTCHLFECCDHPKELWFVPNAGHQDVCETGGDVYREKILEFLDRRLAA